MHLNRGLSRVGSRVLSAEGVSRMQEEQIEVVEPWSHGRARGLGWGIYRWNGTDLLGHDGGTIGQNAFLRVVPERQLGVVLLTNGFTGKDLARELFKELFGAHGMTPTVLPEPRPDVRIDAESFEGSYDRLNVATTIRKLDGGLGASITVSGALAGLLPPLVDQPLEPIDERNFILHIPSLGERAAMTFFDFDRNGRPGYMHLLGRAARRTT
jgi:CubicO group peptidase (beta-lactamase class C family)